MYRMSVLVQPASNQVMQLTAPRLVSPRRAATFRLQPRALPGAVADCVSLDVDEAQCDEDVNAKGGR